MCPLVPVYGLLLFSCVLSSSVIVESDLLSCTNFGHCSMRSCIKFHYLRLFSYLCGGCWLFSCSSERASVPV